MTAQFVRTRSSQLRGRTFTQLHPAGTHDSTAAHSERGGQSGGGLLIVIGLVIPLASAAVVPHCPLDLKLRLIKQDIPSSYVPLCSAVVRNSSIIFLLNEAVIRLRGWCHGSACDYVIEISGV